MADEVIAGRYRLERRLGGGGSSEVWAATDLELDRAVAVKLLAPHADPARFELEARAVAALSHPNVCTLYAYGETNGRPFIVLEHLPGGSLEDRLGAGAPLEDDQTALVATEIAAGLAHAHDRGVVHRDLKPANVLFDAAGRAKIADFGIARMGEAELTETGTVLGTAAYLSPEQAGGWPATPTSDVYAFGVILFRMLTGRLPFEADDALAVAAMHRDRAAPPVAVFRPNAPARLESVAAAALAKSPSDRPPDGRALVAELAGTTRAAGTEATTRVLAPRRKRRRAPILLAAAAILAAAGVALAIAVTTDGGGGGGSPAPSTTATRRRPSAAVSTAPAPPSPPAAAPPAPTSRPATSVPSTGTTAPPPPTLPSASTPRPTTSTASVPPVTLPATTAQTTTAPPPTTPATTALTTAPTTSAATSTGGTTTGASATTTTAPAASTTVPG